MRTISDLPSQQFPVQDDLEYRGRWVANEFSNMLLVRGGRTMSAFGLSFRESENLFVACKTNDQEQRRVIAEMPPSLAKTHGRSMILREDWELVCVAAMSFAIWHKYPMERTYESEMLLRLHRKPELIVEWNNWGDRRWGCAFRAREKIATGKNVLGYLLEIRGAELAGEVTPFSWHGAVWDELPSDELQAYQREFLQRIVAVQTHGKVDPRMWNQ